MSNSDMFAVASRKKFRYPSPQGALTVEDLWDIPLTSTRPTVANLDSIAIALDKQLKDSGGTTSFVKKTTKADDDMRTAFDIVLYVINAKQEEAEAANAASEKKAQKQRIMEIIGQKQDEALAGKSVEELNALLADL